MSFQKNVKKSCFLKSEKKLAYETYGRHEQFLDLFSGMFQLDGRSVLGVFDCDEHVQIFVQMFPLGFATHLLLLHAAGALTD